MRRLVQSVMACLLVLSGLAFTPLAHPESALADDPLEVELTLTTCTEAAFDSKLATAQSFRLGTIRIECGGTITFTSEKKITKDVTIIGNSGVVIDGGNSRRLFFVETGRLVLDGMTLRNGKADFKGGAIFNLGRLEIKDSTFSGSSLRQDSGTGGAIHNEGNAFVSQSTFSDNSAPLNGGAIYNDLVGTLDVAASTFNGNSAGFRGGAIYNSGLDIDRGTLSVAASTLSGNSAGDSGGAIYHSQASEALLPSLISSILANSPTGGNCGGPMHSQGSNLSDDASCGLTATGDNQNSTAVNLDPLADNGGPTLTMHPQSDSDAIDAADCASSSDLDQRGLFRPDTGCDIGAVEAEATLPPTISSVANNGPVGEGSQATITVAATDPDGDDNLLLYSYDCDGDGRPDSNHFQTSSNTAQCTDFEDDGSFAVNVWVEDNGGGETTGSTVVVVNNVAPSVSLPVIAPAPSTEGQSVVASATFSDPGALDTHTCTVDYGDGPQVGVVSGGTCTGPSHIYLDDGPIGTPSDLAVVTIEVIDDDGGRDDALNFHQVNDVAPVVSVPVVGGSPSDEGESVVASASFTDAGILDTHTCEIDWGDGTVEAGTVDEQDGNGTCEGSHPYADDGSYTVAITVTNDDTGAGSNSVIHTVNNVLPAVNTPAVSPSPPHEGESVVFSASFTDPGVNDSHTCVVEYGDGSTGTGTVSGTICSGPGHTYVDNGDYTVTIYVCDDDRFYRFCGNSSIVQTVNNVAPSIEWLEVGPTLVLVDTEVTLSADFTDPGRDIHAAIIDWGDGVVETISVVGHGSGTVEHSHAYAVPGVYTVVLTVIDGDDSDTAVFDEFIVVYDPESASVTGNGAIDSPAGAYRLDPTMSGTARFGFVSKYQNGASVPTGKTQFQFRAGDLRFQSESYEWLIVNQGGTNAQFKGAGTINAELAPSGDAYKFMIWAGDGTPDTFRIRIWYDGGGSEVEIYDNGVNQPIAKGKITIR